MSLAVRLMLLAAALAAAPAGARVPYSPPAHPLSEQDYDVMRAYRACLSAAAIRIGGANVDPPAAVVARIRPLCPAERGALDQLYRRMQRDAEVAVHGVDAEILSGFENAAVAALEAWRLRGAR